MPKRKRASPSPSQAKPEKSVARQKKLCTQRITTALKPLLAALRVGAGLERQKHSRRKKTAQNKKDTKALERLDVEYAVLKGLDLEKLADQNLRRTIGKVKSLKEAEALQEYINGGSGGEEKGYEGRAPARDPATLNVTARLYKVPAVKKVVDEVIEDLKVIVGASERAEKAQNEKKEPAKRSKQEDKEDEDMPDVSDEMDDPYMAFSARIAEPSSGEDDSEDSVSGDERPPSIGDSESEHNTDDDLYARLQDSEGDSFQNFSSEEAEDTEPEPERDSRAQFISVSSLSDDSSASDADSESDNEALIAPSKSKSKTAKEIKPTTSSAFLPALSHAAYFSGSESEASDLDVDVAPRKNRRGQRARQKIAEAKFGAKAKHLENGGGRNQGWDAKRGAVGDDKRGRGNRGGAPRGRGPQQSGGNSEPLGEKKSAGVKRDDKGELHPSWQAAKAAKESKKLKIDIKGAKAPGKKVVFD
ncbi:Bud-site selection protein [Pyrenochaeta sp. MPI-SDFR-AT-0127]|nr:Bud-site selection protein [Pyrenochaeta sp. MPI-SDFR-AT-0127]